MSSLLKEAIIDAKALRETALKSAESSIVDKYSDEVRQALEKLLEQEEADLGLGDPAADLDLGADLGGEAPPEGGDDFGLDAAPMGEPEEGAAETAEEVAGKVPLAATDDLSEMEGENLSKFPDTGADTEITVDLGALQEAVEALKTELEDNEEIDITEEALAALLSEDEIEEGKAGSFAGEEAEEDDEDDDDSAAALAGSAAAEEADSDAMTKAGLEESELNEEGLEVDSLADAIIEKLTVDMHAELPGWAGQPSYVTKHQMEKELARRRSTDEQDALEDLRVAHDELVFENKQLKEHNTQYTQALQELREGLQDVNLSNARLLYTNRILKNASLNERQKSKIVEAISNAGSITEARTIYNTLESTVETAPKSGPQSLSEAISRRSSVIRATRQETQTTDPFSLRMKQLAGIKS